MGREVTGKMKMGREITGKCLIFTGTLVSRYKKEREENFPVSSRNFPYFPVFSCSIFFQYFYLMLMLLKLDEEHIIFTGPLTTHSC